MKTKKPKRIRAHKVIRQRSYDTETGKLNTEVLYYLKQSDIRALAEQMALDMEDHEPASDKRFRPFFAQLVAKKLLYALKRAGMTPGKVLKTDGTVRSVKNAMKRATAGDVIMIPPGVHNWTKKKGAQ